MRNVFLKKNSGINPTLYMDMVFVEMLHPILFSCTDDNGNYYICSCCRRDGEAQEWIIAPTACEKLIELLTDKITIRQIFEKCNGIGYVAMLRAGESEPIVYKTAVNDMPADMLPTPQYYMEADAGEFDEEINALKNAVKTRNMHIIHEEAAFSIIAMKPQRVSFSIPAINRGGSAYTKRNTLWCSFVCSVWG